MTTKTSSFVSRSMSLGVALGLGSWAPAATAAEPAPVTPATVEPAPVAPAPVAPAPVEAPPAPVATPSTPEATPVQPAPAPSAMQPVGSEPSTDDARVRRLAEERRSKGLMISGWAVLGTSYAVSVLVGAIVDDTSGGHPYGRWMYVPVIGPIGAATQSEYATGAVLTVGMAGAQIAGLTMGIVGTVRYSRARRSWSMAALPSRGGGQVAFRMRF